MKNVVFILSICLCFSAPAEAAETPAAPAAASSKPVASNDDLAALTARAEKGDALAADALAGRYARGQGVPLDDAASVKWWQKAAEGGNADAQYQLGHEFYEGTSLYKRDYKTACKWFGESARQDVIASEFYSGLCYADGLGGQKSHADAYFWLLVAKKHGYMVSPILLNKASGDLTTAEKDAADEKVHKWFVAHPLKD